MSPEAAGPIFTIGHSTRPIDAFIALLRGCGVGLLVDIRRFPRSRHNPQYEAGSLAAAVAGVGIAYRHAPGLGGRRRPLPTSNNGGWRNEAFRGFADYMQTEAFNAALEEVVDEAREQSVALMCSEGAPFRCHRSLVADALVARGLDVAEITGVERSRPHHLTPFARVEGHQVSYPAPSPFPSAEPSL